MGKPSSGEAAVLILAGPTASGKTPIALEIAQRFGAEIIGADSRQIYRDMPIGTAAPTPAERARVPHHLVDFLAPTERYSAALFAADALAAIRRLAARGRRALVVGGTGFYVRALCGDVALDNAYDAAVRARLARESHLHPPEILHEWLRARDPARAGSLDAHDRYRVLRALEITLAPAQGPRDDPRPDGGTAAAVSLRAAGIPFEKIVLDVATEDLDASIAARVDRMLECGLVEEALRIGAGAVAADAVGYPDAIAYASGRCTARELRTLLIRETRRYARRQRTWFRAEPGVTWVDRRDAPAAIAGLARKLPGWG